MRLSSAHIRRFRDAFFAQEGTTAWGYRILSDILDYRERHALDDTFPYEPGSLRSPEALQYEMKKLMAIFELTRQDPTVEDKLEFIEEFKKIYPPQEVDELVEEYFPELLEPHKAN